MTYPLCTVRVSVRTNFFNCFTTPIFKTKHKQHESIIVSSSETQGFNGDRTGRERLGAGKRWEEGRGREGKEARGSTGKLLYTDHFSINYFSEPLLASFLIKFKMRPMKSDHMLIWKSLRTLELRPN